MPAKSKRKVRVPKSLTNKCRVKGCPKVAAIFVPHGEVQERYCGEHWVSKQPIINRDKAVKVVRQ